jgi:hypothetical protein
MKRSGDRFYVDERAMGWARGLREQKAIRYLRFTFATDEPEADQTDDAETEHRRFPRSP